MRKNRFVIRFPKYALFLLLLFVSISSIAQQSFNKNIPIVLFTNADVIEKEKHDYSILKTAVDLINATPSGSEITVCIFKMNYDPMILALEKARDRNVSVKIILNKGETSDDVNKKINKYLEDAFVNYYYIDNDISKNSIVYNKFILFSQIITNTGQSEDIIFQTSSNFTKKDCGKIQDLVVFSNEEIFTAYNNYWDEIQSLAASNDLSDFNYFTVSNTNDIIKAYFFPKRSKGKSVGRDNIETVLRNISDPSTSIITFIHGKWSKNRSKIIDELEDLVSDGARVQIITNDDLDKGIIEKLNDLDATIIYIDPDDADIHTKIMFVRGEYKGAYESIVWTGTHNFTRKSLRKNFEVLLKIRDANLYNRYDKFRVELIQYARQK